MKEIWKDIKGYEGLYQVSNMGRVRNKDIIMKLKLENTYLRIGLSKNNEFRSFSVKTLVAEAFDLDKPEGAYRVVNKDGDPYNCRLDNLEWLCKKQKVKPTIIDLPGEIWKEIEGYEGLYWVSNKGRIKNNERIMKIKVSPRLGYASIKLYKDGKYKDCRIQRLVAFAFIPNDDPVNKVDVNHKNENKLDNSVENLEWATKSYNVNYGTRNERASEKLKGRYNEGQKKQMKKVRCITTGKTFDSLAEAARFYNIKAPCHISRHINGRFKQAGKLSDGTPLTWEFIEES